MGVHITRPDGGQGNERVAYSADVRFVFVLLASCLVPSLSLAQSLTCGPAEPGKPALALPEILDDLERQLILKAYREAKGVKTETARLLGIKPSALYYKLDKYRIA